MNAPRPSSPPRSLVCRTIWTLAALVGACASAPALSQSWPSQQVPLGFTQLASAVPHIKEGKLKAIAVTGPQRSRFLPDVPTLAELGHKDLGTTIWFGLFAPARVPGPTLDAIRTAAKKAQADPVYRERLEALNFDIPTEDLAAFEKTIAAETARWAELVKATGFKASD